MGVKESKISGCSNKVRFGQKGQVTVFIIIGILVLFFFAAVLYITQSTVKEELTSEGFPVVSEIPSAFEPIKIYTDDCISQVAKQGLQLLGQQGGYIYPELMGDYSGIDPTNADGLDMGSFKVPYWHYNINPNNQNLIVFSSLKPQLHSVDDPEFSIESQLERYVEENIDNCLNGYASLKQEGFAIEENPTKKAKVIISAEVVNFWLEQEIDAKKESAEAKLDNFYVKVPLRLEHYYDVANEITAVETNFSFLERQTLDLIQVFSAVDVNKLPPTSAVGFDMVPLVSWNSEKVKQDMKEILNSYVPLIQFSNSENAYHYNYPVSDLSGLFQQTYDNMILPFGDNQLGIYFNYLDWEPYFNVNDVDNKLKPDHTSIHYWMLDFAMQHYQTVYDLSNPVLITLKDNQAFDGEGYEFNFALESNIRDNNIVKNEQETLPSRSTFSESMLCDEDKFDTGLLKTVVVDSFTKEPLELVQIGFSVPNENDCDLGLTDKKGTFTSKFPAIYGGTVSLIKENYLTDLYPLDTYNYKDNNAIIGYAIEGMNENVIEMHKYKTINVSVKKKNLEKCIGQVCPSQGLFNDGEVVYSYSPELLGSNHSWRFIDVARPLGENEQAMITLKRVGDLNGHIYNQDFSTGINFDWNDKSKEILLVPGIYEVTGTVILNEGLAIPEEERCKLLDCFTFDEVYMDSTMIGDFNWDSPNTYIKITPEDLYGNNDLTLYVPTFNLKSVPNKAHFRVVEDLEMMNKINEIFQLPKFRSSLEPKFS